MPKNIIHLMAYLTSSLVWYSQVWITLSVILLIFFPLALNVICQKSILPSLNMALSSKTNFVRKILTFIKPNACNVPSSWSSFIVFSKKGHSFFPLCFDRERDSKTTQVECCLAVKFISMQSFICVTWCWWKMQERVIATIQ